MKQQENEREDKAIQALKRALSLDAQHSAALLALAVSYTNENNRFASLDSISRWIDIQAEQGRYKAAVNAHRMLNQQARDEEDEEEMEMLTGMGVNLKQKDLVECLMTMARMSPDGSIDADIQIALGVLLNSSEVRSSSVLFRDAVWTNGPSWYRNTTKHEIVSRLLWLFVRTITCSIIALVRRSQIAGTLKKH